MKSFTRALLVASSKGATCHRIVDLKACDAHLSQLALDPQMRGMGRVGVESRLALELAVEHDVAGVIDATVVEAYFKMEQSGHFAAKPLEAGPQELRRLAAVLLRIAHHIPHHDMLDHSASLKEGWMLWIRMMKSSPERPAKGQSSTCAPPCDEDAKSASKMRFILCACCAGTFEGSPV